MKSLREGGISGQVTALQRISPRSPLFLSTTMTSPSKPLSIKSPRTQPVDEVPTQQSSPPAGTPDLRALRAHYIGTPQIPNIPPRGTPGARTPIVRPGTPSTPAQPTVDTPSSPSHRPTDPVVGGISATRRPSFGAHASGSPAPDVPPLDLDGLPDEEKAKVVARHLVLKDERTKSDQSKASGPSDPNSSRSRPSSQQSNPSQSQNNGKAKDTSEPFSIPYDTPGAAVT